MKREGWLIGIIVILVAIIAFMGGYLWRHQKSPSDSKEAYPAYPVYARQAVAATPPARLAMRSVFDEDWDPFREMEDMRRLMAGMMSSRMPQTGLTDASYRPDIDIKETASTYVLKLDLPGLDKDKIDVKVRDGYLTISGQREAEAKHEDEGFYRMERSFGSFTRSFPLPGDADAEAMKAQTQDGVLTITIPKKQPAAGNEKQVLVT